MMLVGLRESTWKVCLIRVLHPPSTISSSHRRRQSKRGGHSLGSASKATLEDSGGAYRDVPPFRSSRSRFVT
jgi:hypothetical protein